VSHEIHQTGYQWINSLLNSRLFMNFTEKAKSAFTECVNYMIHIDAETLIRLMQLARQQSDDDIPLLGWWYLPSKSYRFFSVSQHPTQCTLLLSLLDQEPSLRHHTKTKAIFFHIRSFHESVFYPLCSFAQLAWVELGILNAFNPLAPDTSSSLWIYRSYVLVRPHFDSTMFYLFQCNVVGVHGKAR